MILKLFICLVISFSNFQSNEEFYKSNSEIVSVEYIAETRGSSIKIIVSSNKIIYNRQSFKISSKNWKNILKDLKKIPLTKLASLDVPSDRRFSDAAMHAKIIVNTTNSKYISSDFDHDNPPIELIDLINSIQDLIEN